MKKTICVMTSTRAEYGLLRPLISKISQDCDLELRLVVTGTHLSDDYGNTVDEIVKDGYVIDKCIKISLDNKTPVDMCESMAEVLKKFSAYFYKSKPDMLVVLGDRYEAFAVTTAASVCKIPIAHLHGGETTEGAYDEFFRHSITKMSYLHFTSCEAFRKRVIQLGESPDRVFDVGAPGVENIKNIKLKSYDEIVEILGVKRPYAMVTFHPVTYDCISVESQINELFSAMEESSDINYVITKANSDTGGDIINSMIDGFADSHSNVKTFKSLGIVNYLSAMKYSSMVIGNSSSGIIETPTFKIPTVNIGDRQKGRIQAESIINCKSEKSEIKEAIKKAQLYDCKNVINPYEGENTTKKIFETIKSFMLNGKIDLKKKFYDLR